jgi:hypothetical protein
MEECKYILVYLMSQTLDISSQSTPICEAMKQLMQLYIVIIH